MSSSLPLKRHPNSQAPTRERSDGLCVCVLPCPLFPKPFPLFAVEERHCVLSCFSFPPFFSTPLFKVVVNKLMGQAGGEPGLKNYGWEKVSVIGFGSQNGFMLPDAKPSSMH